MIDLSLRGQDLRWVTTPVAIATDSIGQVSVNFRRGEDWQGLLLTAQFTTGAKTYSVYMGEESTCFIPTETIPGELIISVFGVEGDRQRSTTKPLGVEVVKSGYVKDGEAPLPPTTDLYNQLVGQLEQSKAIAAQSAEAAQTAADTAVTASVNPPKIENGTWWLYDAEGGYTDSGLPARGEKGDTGERGEKGEKGEKGNTGEKGADGKTPVKGVDYFTDDERNEFAMLIADEVMKSLGVIVDSINGEVV